MQENKFRGVLIYQKISSGGNQFGKVHFYHDSPQFTSSEFELCMRENGIKHIKSSPYHPASNGEAERFVQTFKHTLKAAKNDPRSLNTKIY